MDHTAAHHDDAPTAPTPEPRSDVEAFHYEPEASPWTTRQNIVRAVWMLIGRPAFRLTFHNWDGVRRVILRLFGADIGAGARIRSTVRIEIPWNIKLGEKCVVGDYAILYSLGVISIGPRAVVSQYAHLCAGTHDFTKPSFPLLRPAVDVGHDAWIGADAFVGPGVTVGPLAILGARSSAFKDLEENTIYVGNPARPLRKRVEPD